MKPPYLRTRYFTPLWERLRGEPRLIQVVVGPRQVGKTTLALQVVARWKGPTRYDTADQPVPPTTSWIEAQWDAARRLVGGRRRDALLVLDEIQKVPRWSEVVKRLADEDRRRDIPLRVVLLGSSALLMQRGLSESLAGRFELHRHPHWSFDECRRYFGLSLDEYVYFGGYPGALALRGEEARWRQFVRDALIETVLSKDVLLLAPVSKPALLRQVFGLAVSAPAQIVSYQHMLGSLQDAGNATTIASYLRLLSSAFLVCPLERFSGSRVKQRGSTPKLVVLDNALVTAMQGVPFAQMKRDPASWGRLVENVVGAQLYWATQIHGGSLYYWRDRHEEVDFVIEQGQARCAIEVKSGAGVVPLHGLETFRKRHPQTRVAVIAPVRRRTKDTTSPLYLSLERFFKQVEEGITELLGVGTES